jgi:hypothetical protein
MSTTMTVGEIEAAARAVSIDDLRPNPQPGELVIERTNFDRWQRAVGWLVAREGSEQLGDDTWVIRRLDGSVERWENATCYALPAWLVEVAVRD